MKRMFPYNDTENAWISETKLSKAKATYNNHSLFMSISVAFVTASLSTLIPILIYFSRLNLF